MATTTATPMASRLDADALPFVAVESTAIAPMLVATDASESADPALIAAQLLAERLHAGVQVLSVFDPKPAVVSTTSLAVTT